MQFLNVLPIFHRRSFAKHDKYFGQFQNNKVFRESRLCSSRKMGKLTKNLSLVRRADNRIADRPPPIANANDALATGEEPAKSYIRAARREQADEKRRVQQDEGQFLWSNIGAFLPHFFLLLIRHSYSTHI